MAELTDASVVTQLLDGSPVFDPSSPPPRPVPIEQRYKRLDGHALQRFRKRFLHKHPLCVMCFRLGRVKAATCCDHIVSIEAGGSNEESNFQALCDDCHVIKSNWERGYLSRANNACAVTGEPLDADHPWNQ